MKILVVDDDAAILNALDANLTSFGYHVVTAKDGLEAVMIIKSSASANEPVSFLVTGLKMPGMSGIGLIRSAREWIPGLKTILISAYGDNNVHKDIKELENCGYLEKPFGPQKLHNLIMELMARKAS